VLVLSGDEAATSSIAAMVRHAFSLPFELDQLQVTVEASLGVAATGADAAAGDLLRQADRPVGPGERGRSSLLHVTGWGVLHTALLAARSVSVPAR
jgi:hypothetical protein